MLRSALVRRAFRFAVPALPSASFSSAAVCRPGAGHDGACLCRRQDRHHNGSRLSRRAPPFAILRPQARAFFDAWDEEEKPAPAKPVAAKGATTISQSQSAFLPQQVTVGAAATASTAARTSTASPLFSPSPSASSRPSLSRTEVVVGRRHAESRLMHFSAREMYAVISNVNAYKEVRQRWFRCFDFSTAYVHPHFRSALTSSASQF
jgi:hypothetical protein